MTFSNTKTAALCTVNKVLFIECNLLCFKKKDW